MSENCYRSSRTDSNSIPADKTPRPIQSPQPLMNHEIALLLELVEQSTSLLKFLLTVENRAGVPLFLPQPNITDIRFEHVIEKRRAEWYTSLLVSSSGSGFSLQPAQGRGFEFLVRPNQIVPPRLDEHGDYYRFSIDIRPGEYSSYYHLEVGTDYFDPDSHMRLDDLERMACEERATVWLGNAESNRITVVRAN
jgi:hypothetical protein